MMTMTLGAANPVPLTLAAPAWPVLAAIGGVLLLFLFGAAFLASRYKRCPSNRVMVVYGRVRGQAAARSSSR